MLKKLYYNHVVYATVAQLDRVLGYEPSGQGFESLQLHQIRREGQNIDSLFFIS